MCSYCENPKMYRTWTSDLSRRVIGVTSESQVAIL